MIYADTSALAKLVVEVPESAALRAWLRERTDEELAVNMIGAVELQRAVGRVDPTALPRAMRLLRSLTRIEVTGATWALAATISPPTVRTLDALHIASAAILAPELTAFLTYHERMGEAAGALGLPILTPH